MQIRTNAYKTQGLAHPRYWVSGGNCDYLSEWGWQKVAFGLEAHEMASFLYGGGGV